MKAYDAFLSLNQPAISAVQTLVVVHGLGAAPFNGPDRRLTPRCSGRRSGALGRLRVWVDRPLFVSRCLLRRR
jgi:hypothetical protein